MKKLKAQIKKILDWITRQYRKHPIRSAAVTLPVVALVTVGILFLCGVFNTSEHWSYLPNRNYILAPADPAEPQTLYELLHSDTPDIETFLRNPSIAQELLNAGKWTDIVDSRLALYNLRELDRQLEARLTEGYEYFDFAGYIQPGDGLLAQIPGISPVSSAVGELSIVQLAALDGIQYASVFENLQTQYVLLDTLKAVTGKLIAPELITEEELITLDVMINLKGVWQNPGETLIHMTPEGDGLPYNGYTLKRIVNGQETVIAEKAAAESDGLNGNIMRDVSRKVVDEKGKTVNEPFSGYIQELYQQAQLTPEKLTALGNISEEDFRKTLYRVDSLAPKDMLSGSVTFSEMRDLQITIPGDFKQKMPETDRLLASPIQVMSQKPGGAFLTGAVNSMLLEKFSFVPSEQITGITVFGKHGDIRYDTAEAILSARQQISTMSFVDSEFAEEAGFLVRDDLSALNLPNGTEVTYVVSANGVESTITVTYGKETNLSAPQGLMGYGYDGVVSLRWDDLCLDAEADPDEKGIISGYHIERRLKGESNFTQITAEPIVIGYMLDELGWLQSPIYFQDEVKNGMTAEYRVRSIDIFGRTSECSETIEVKVEKITPPNAPSAGVPVLSGDVDTSKNYSFRSPDYGVNVSIQNSVKLNSGKKGVVIPIYTDSPDTARFTVYRAVAVGSGNFGAPKPIANLLYDNPMKDMDEETNERATSEKDKVKTKNVTVNKVNQITLREFAPNWPNLVYFDADIEEGCTYKYWIAAWDDPEWNNESAWSQSVTAAIPTDKAPKEPGALDIAMLARELPDRSQDSPGLVNDAKATFKELYQSSGSSSFRIPNPDPESAAAKDTKIDGETVRLADHLGVSIGSFSKAGFRPIVISTLFDNLPAQKYIHMFAAVRGETVLADGTARLKWPAHSGEGLQGYNVYQAMFDISSLDLDLETLQHLTRDELLQLGPWQKMNDNPVTQNQFIIGGLPQDPDKLYLYLVCLQPYADDETEAPESFSAPEWPSMDTLKVVAPGGTVTINQKGEVSVTVDGWISGMYTTGITYSPDDRMYEMKCLTAALAQAQRYEGNPFADVLDVYYQAYAEALAKMAPYGLEEPEKPKEPKALTLSSLNLNLSGTVTIDLLGGVIVTVPGAAGMGGTNYVRVNTGIPLTEQIAKDPLLTALHIMQCLNYAKENIFDPALNMAGVNISPGTVWNTVFFGYYNAYSNAYGTYYNAVRVYENALALYEQFMDMRYIELISGHVKIEWDIPEDPQIKYFRVYRAEVMSFKNPVNESLLEWTLVGDYLTAPQFTDPVEQSHARYYYYKVTTVSPWGVESTVGITQRFRVPSTMPPATPNLLVPLQRKDGVQINFSAVQYCDKYIVYRAEIPKITDSYLAGLNAEIKNALFSSPTVNDTFLSTILNTSISLPASTNLNRTLNAISRFNTLNYADENTMAAIGNISADARLDAFSVILDDFGPLALADYCDLSVDMMKRVGWVEVGTLEADYDTTEDILDPETGLPGMLKPLSIFDETAEYGKMYLYTVQAWNDDNLGSTRPEPVEATPRRSGPFDPIAGLKADTTKTQPTLSWDTPTMKNLDNQQCLDETVGYIVYRSDTKDGEYYQASPMVFEPEWVDEGADPYAYNWYKVKVLDTGGYLSEFSEPLLVRRPFTTIIKPFIPPLLIDPGMKPPVVNIPGGPYTVKQGERLVVTFTVTGDEPIRYSADGSARGGEAIAGMTVDGNAKTITVPNTLAAGSYGVTLTAENDAGSYQASFNFTVETSVTAPKITIDGSRFSIQQGTAFKTAYTLTGTEPITVTVAAANSKGSTVSGFSVNTSTKTVGAPNSLAAGICTVTVTAKNSAGESSASFTLEVTTAPVEAKPPAISFGNSRYNVQQGTAFQTTYTLSGTEPVSVTITATNERGTSVSGFTVNTTARTVNAPASLSAGTYTVTATAKNSAGESSAKFTLEVTAARTAPVIAEEKHGYSFEVTMGGQGLNVPVAATGSTPITWSLEASDKMPLPIFVEIDVKTGVLTTTARIVRGTHYFIIRATNDVGSDTQFCTLYVNEPRVAPKITNTMYANRMTQGTDYSMQFSATGSTPLSWSLEPVSSRQPVPAEASIDSTGKLSIKGSIATGSHSFIVKVANDVGSNTFEMTITVQGGLGPIVPRGTAEQSTAPGGIEQLSFLSNSSGMEVTQLALIQPLQPTFPEVTKQINDILVRVGDENFRLTNVNVSQPYEGNSSYYGTALLDMVSYGIPVEIVRANIQTNDTGFYSTIPHKMTAGIIYVPEAVEIPEIGVTIASLNISPQTETAVVSGYVKNPIEGQNLVGDLYAFEFINAQLTSGYIVARNDLPDFRYYQFTIHDSTEFHIRIVGQVTVDREHPENANKPIPFAEIADFTHLGVAGCGVSMKSHLETLNNEGLELSTFSGNLVWFDLNGEMSAQLNTANYGNQSLQLLVPGGAMLRVESAEIWYSHGQPMADYGSLKGRLILPFERDDIEGMDVTAAYAGHHPDTNEMDILFGLYKESHADRIEDSDYINDSDFLNMSLNSKLYHFGQIVQQNSLLIVPNDTRLQNQLSYVEINLDKWDGNGFTVEKAEMTPARVTNRNLGVDMQRTQAIVVKPTYVSVDLDRNGSVNPFADWNKQEPNEYETKETMLPKETQKDFWVGIIMHGGDVALPEAFIKPKDDNVRAITFTLAPGEMIYDLNGFNYQTYLYSNEGVPAKFGDAFGGFEDVKVYDVLLDMYANRVNMEINVEVMLEHLNYEWVKAKMYTNKEDNADGRAGEFLCSVAPTTLFDVFGTEINMVIDGGFFRKDGLHMNGSMVINTDEVQTMDEPLAFINMIVPAKMAMSREENDPGRKYMNVSMDKPVDIRFQGFTMEVRRFDIENLPGKDGFAGLQYIELEHPFKLTLSGSTQLSENIPLGQETTDSIIMTYSAISYYVMNTYEIIPPFQYPYNAMIVVRPQPQAKVMYEQSRSELKASFDGCVEITGTLVPKLTDAGNNSASQMSAHGDNTGLQVMLLAAGGLPDLPPLPNIPDKDQYLNDSVGTAKEQAKAYQKALEAEIAKYMDEVEKRINDNKNLTQSQADEYRQKAKDALRAFTNSALENLIDEVKKYASQIKDELDKYIDVAMLGQGLIEFNTEGLGLNFLEQLQNLDIETEMRIGYDMKNKRCYFAVGLMPLDLKPINFGAGSVKDFTGIVTYNMTVNRNESKQYDFPDSPGQMKDFIKKMNVHREPESTFAAAIRGTLVISGFAEIKNLYFGFEAGPSVEASGELYVPLDVKSMIEGKPEKRIGSVAIMYRHPDRYFSFSITLDQIDVVAAKVSGSLGFEFSPNLFGISIGYPETLAGNVAIFRVGVGVGFRIDSQEGMLIKAKMEMGLEKSVTVAIVYLKGYLYAGAEGAVHFDSGPIPDSMMLALYLKGGIKGGVTALGKSYDIINLYLDARGELWMYPGSMVWELECTAKVGYSLNLFLVKLNGSVSASFNTTIG